MAGNLGTAGLVPTRRRSGVPTKMDTSAVSQGLLTGQGCRIMVAKTE